MTESNDETEESGTGEWKIIRALRGVKTVIADSASEFRVVQW